MKKLQSIQDQIAIWSLFLPEHRTEIEACHASLSPDEQERADQFTRPQDATQFTLSRGILRRILANLLEAPANEITFQRNENGKPFLPGHPLEFNVSHSQDRLLIAITSGRSVGIDIERRREKVRMTAITNRWFSTGEQTFLENQTDPTTHFFNIWAQKEAYVKARGVSIYHDLKEFSVPLANPSGPSAEPMDSNWVFRMLDIDPLYAAAVVYQAPAVPLIFQPNPF
jgi:4'-phosphopantetheinyl transferase